MVRLYKLNLPAIVIVLTGGVHRDVFWLQLVGVLGRQVWQTHCELLIGALLFCQCKRYSSQVLSHSVKLIPLLHTAEWQKLDT